MKEFFDLNLFVGFVVVGISLFLVGCEIDVLIEGFDGLLEKGEGRMLV